jgi:hypothetical protein
MGRARAFSKENALEIAILSILMQGGMKPQVAAEYVAKLFKEIKAKKPHGWAVFFTGGNMPVDYIVSDKPPGPTILSRVKGVHVVNVAKLETEIDEFFEDKES